MVAKCVIVPSIAVSMLPSEGITLAFAKLTWEEFATQVKMCEKVVNYIRHKPTNDLLLTIIQRFESGTEYRIDMNDVIILLGLKSRAPVPGADVNVSPSDLLIYLAKPV
jgi:hypothetical protein